MNVLYEDENLVICQKEVGFVSELSQKDPSLANEVLQKYGYAGIVHRLDMNVGGAICYAKTKSSAGYLSGIVAARQMQKQYLAVVEGVPAEPKGEFKDYLFKDSSKNKVYTVKRMRKGVKEASLYYEVLETAKTDNKTISLVKITLDTGRSHQIRVQFSSRKMPLVGDGKYGSRDNRCTVALWCHSLSFAVQGTGETIEVRSLPSSDSYPWNLFEYTV